MSLTVSRDIGDITVTVLTDGELTFEPAMFPGTDAEHIDALLESGGENAIRTNFNATLVRTGGRTVLADAGPRELFGPTCGRLPEALAEAGVSPEDIDTVFMTHLHPDHVVGSVDAAGKAAFPNAEFVVTEAERGFWNDTDYFSGADETLRAWQAFAKSALDAYGDRLRIINGEAEVAPGMTALPLPGHTPGHSGFRVASGDDQLLHVGDIFHAPALQLPDPEISVVFDVDADTARDTRKRLLDQLASDGALMSGGHMLHPALGRIRRQGQGYEIETL